ncbi:KTSC domain-containing protein [Microscilla marina]|uniref:KTSC domain-containing protein n=1 Tax=Microscilla marina ATCC 23134 TaxID=313606 RepID=A1ZYT1_MICM2|nr:KTSC domain-containing protein [Microscilla marina]EAY24428.1 conserved hypothetical protein [Microscilla marina ATCC 23134]
MAKFKRNHTESSLITSTAYDPFSQVLEIVFCRGGIYEYANVSEQEFKNMQNAKSVGLYFNGNIRNKKKELYRKVRD